MGLFRRVFGQDRRTSVEAESIPPQEPLDDGERRFYVYAHRDVTGQVFYIGKGTGDRAWSRERHPVWTRYVDRTLGGVFSVDVLADGLTEADALNLEDDLIRRLGEQLINWVNPGRKMDHDALREYWVMRKESQALTERAKQVAKEDPAAAVPICRQALDLVHEYSQLVLETGIVEETREKNRNGDATVGDPHVIYRLALCLNRAGDLPELIREVDNYFARYPDAVSHAPGEAALKLRARVAAKIGKPDDADVRD